VNTFRADATPVPVLRVRGVTRRLGDRMALDGVSLDVVPGRIVVLAGPNGAGKTTLMRVVTGRLATDAGDVAIEGRAAAEACRRGRIGVVPQDVALYPHLTVRENLAVLGRLAGVPASRLPDRIDEALAWSALADRARSLVRSLSGGMKRRVNLVAGTLHEPALLLLDEPTVGVDAVSVARLHALLRALRDRGIGLLVATHDLDEAAALCDDVAVMAGGRIVGAGPLADVVARAFPDGRELAVTVAAGHAEAAAAVLDADGFRRTTAHGWVRPATDHLADLAVVEQRLRQAGVRLAEARLREPSLRGAVAVLTGSAPLAGDPAEVR
jgi:ABC-2 type transport system ATP-binding protein